MGGKQRTAKMETISMEKPGAGIAIQGFVFPALDLSLSIQNPILLWHFMI